MKTRSKFKCIVILLTVLLILMVPFYAFAAETTLTATVPSEFLMNIEIEGRGSVTVDGREYFESTEIAVKRNENISYKITPAERYELKTVLYNGVNVTQELNDGVFTVFADKGGKLNVIFKTNTIPETGDEGNLTTAFIMVVALAMIVFAKKRFNTNKLERS